MTAYHSVMILSWIWDFGLRDMGSSTDSYVILQAPDALLKTFFWSGTAAYLYLSSDLITYQVHSMLNDNIIYLTLLKSLAFPAPSIHSEGNSFSTRKSSMISWKTGASIDFLVHGYFSLDSPKFSPCRFLWRSWSYHSYWKHGGKYRNTVSWCQLGIPLWHLLITSYSWNKCQTEL